MQKIDDGFRSLKTARAPDLWRDIEGREPRSLPGPSRARRIAVAALALAIAGTGTWLAARAFLATSDPDGKPADDVAGPMVPRLGPSATFPGAHGGGPLYAFGSVWIPQHREPPEEDFILRIDSETLEVIARIPVRVAPGWEVGDSGMTASADGVWVAGGTGDEAGIEKIDPASNQVVTGLPIRGEFAGDLAVLDRSLWVSLFEHGGGVSLRWIRDTYRPDVMTPIEIEGDWIREVFAVGDRIVVHTRGEGEVNRLSVIDPESGHVVARNGIREAIFTDWNGSVWAGAADTILRIDPSTAEIVERYPLGMYVAHTSIAGGAGGLWFIGYDGNEGADVTSRLVRFNPATGEIDASVDVGGDPVALTVGHGAVWVLGYEGKLTRVDL